MDEKTESRLNRLNKMIRLTGHFIKGTNLGKISGGSFRFMFHNPCQTEFLPIDNNKDKRLGFFNVIYPLLTGHLIMVIVHLRMKKQRKNRSVVSTVSYQGVCSTLSSNKLGGSFRTFVD